MLVCRNARWALVAYLEGEKRSPTRRWCLMSRYWKFVDNENYAFKSTFRLIAPPAKRAW